LYKIFIKPILFLFSPETAHHITFFIIKCLFKIPGVNSIFKLIYAVEDKRLERTVFGLTFPNPVGLAAGFDKDAKIVDEFSALGFGFIEIGTVTPVPQIGNDKPRLFRLPDDEAIINRMGFNNGGMKEIAARLRKRKSKVLIGGNIGKNKVTPNEEALNDYIKAFNELFDCVDYFVVNVSSPNTPGLRALQEKEPLKQLLFSLQEVNNQKTAPKPILLKIAPDLTNEQLDDIVEIITETKLSGIIATNTTISRDGLTTPKDDVADIGMGGMSGKPLTVRSTEVIRYLVKKSNGTIPVVGVGGIHSPKDALDKLEAGASLIQLYSGFIYEGPALVGAINKAILKK
jgi:dihydroorotate dehydrogenase